MEVSQSSPAKPFPLNDSGQLSIDFIIGFAIFMTAFIMVITMSSGLLVGLQSRHIDYDAVAYRAGVILSEDAGVPNTWPGALTSTASEEWEFIGRSAKSDVKRFGLCLYKSTPRVFSEAKVLSFHNAAIYDTNNPLTDYYPRIIFGDYPYNMYIVFTPLVRVVAPFSIGSPPSPDTNYGYIRRIVTVKTPGEFSIDLDNYIDPSGMGDGKITIRLDSTELFDLRKGPVYWTDLMKERVKIRFNIVDSNVVAKNPAEGIDLQQVAYGYYKPDPGSPGSEKFEGPIRIVPPSYTEGFTLIGDGTQTGHTLSGIKSNITTEFDAGYFIMKIPEDLTTARIDIIYEFDPATTYIDSQNPIIFQNVPPVLVPGVLEVMVW